MILPAADLKLIREGRKQQIWLPVTRGTQGQRRAPFTPERAEGLEPVPLQERTGGRSIKITLTEIPCLRALLPVTSGDAKRLGYRFAAQAIEAWEAWTGIAATEDVTVWCVNFALGDRSAFYREHQEKYLRRKMGSAKAYTTVPGRAVHHEGAVPDAALAGFAAKARQTREAEARAASENVLTRMRAEIAELDRGGLSQSVSAELERLQKRCTRLSETLQHPSGAGVG